MRIATLVGIDVLVMALAAASAPAVALQSEPPATRTVKACHICDEGLPQATATATVEACQVCEGGRPRPIVHAVMFWMDGCPHCEEVIENVLPALRRRFGSGFDLFLIEVVDTHDVDVLYQVAESYGIRKEETGVPFLIIGDQVLIGSDEVGVELPFLIDAYFSRGGVGWPDIPALGDYHAAALPPPAPARPAAALVRAILFTTLDCHDCAIEVRAALAPVLEEYGAHFEYQTVDIVNPADVEYLYQVAAAYGVPREAVDSPLIIVGDHLLMGENMATELPDLVTTYLERGGVDWPPIPARRGIVISTPIPLPDQTVPFRFAAEQPSGFALAIVIMVLMAAAWVYSLVAFGLGRTFTLPAWGDWLTPILLAMGIGVAAYLSYVETQFAEAACGPVGDCNAVQQSPYARLFGILPVGVVGLLGYLALLAAWLARRALPKLGKSSSILFFGLASLAVLFSIYLTYLEPFVIKAVCLWCLGSSVIVTLLLLLGTPPAVQHFAGSDEAVDAQL
jgi:uncharacterized membrane protein/glutaredoxin